MIHARALRDEVIVVFGLTATTLKIGVSDRVNIVNSLLNTLYTVMIQAYDQLIGIREQKHLALVRAANPSHLHYSTDKSRKGEKNI